jgi:hypothetical protein
MSQNKIEPNMSLDIEKQQSNNEAEVQNDTIENASSVDGTFPETPPVNSEKEMQVQQEHIEPPYTAFSEKEKIFTVIIASFAALISPISASIYFPALNPLAADLHLDASTINLSITVYMVSTIQMKQDEKRVFLT